MARPSLEYTPWIYVETSQNLGQLKVLLPHLRQQNYTFQYFLSWPRFRIEMNAGHWTYIPSADAVDTEYSNSLCGDS